MKEIALFGPTGHVHGDVLGALLARGLSVNTMVDFPERVMVQDSRLTIMHRPLNDHERVKEALEGYHDVVLTYNDNLSDSDTNDLALKYFIDTVHAAREAGVARIIVVA